MKKDNADGRSLFLEEAERLTGIKQQQVSRWKSRLAEPDKYRAMLYGVAYVKAMVLGGMTANYSSETDEWYTPAM